MITCRNSSRIPLLLVDAEHEFFAKVVLLLEEMAPRTFLLEWASTYSFAVNLFRRDKFMLCFSNVRIGHRSGTDLLRDLRARGYNTPFILLASGEEMADSGVACAMDYLDRDRLSPEMLRLALRDAGFRPNIGVPELPFQPGLMNPMTQGTVRVAA